MKNFELKLLFFFQGSKHIRKNLIKPFGSFALIV